jgi:hypothetical protein
MVLHTLVGFLSEFWKRLFCSGLTLAPSSRSTGCSRLATHFIWACYDLSADCECELVCLECQCLHRISSGWVS